MKHVFEYAVFRAVPRVDRGECINVGVVVYCQGLDYLAAFAHVDADRLRALDASTDPAAVRAALTAVTRVCDGGVEAGPQGELSRGQRFRWVTAPRSTVVQPGPVHAGLTDDPAGDLERLAASLVR